jgi:hypothetical protein
MIGGIVGIGAINQIPPRAKADYETAFEHFLGEKYGLNEVEEVNEGEQTIRSKSIKDYILSQIKLYPMYSAQLKSFESNIKNNQNLTEKEAFKHEVYMINVLGRKDLGTGILRNRTNGGEGISGRVISDECKRKQSEAKKGKANMPGHVRASINWNTLKRMFDDKYSMNITDGAKVIVCKLKQNPMGFTSVAYPVDELRLPQWFKDMPFEHAEMESTVIDKKLDNLIGVLKWDIGSTEEKNTFNSLFEF